MADKICGIYCIENKITSKKYIGYTKDFTKRKYQHLDNLSRGNHINSHLQNAYNKYGKENFYFRIIIRLPKIELILKLIEIFSIYYYDSYFNGYNLTFGGDGNSSERSDDVRKRISATLTGRHQSEEAKIKIGNYHRGRNKPEGFGKKVSDALRGKKQSEKHRIKNSEARRGKLNQNSTNEYVGVYEDKTMKRNKKWRAQIRNFGKVIRLGRYFTKIEAAKAYDVKSWELYGELKYLNFPEDYGGKIYK